MLYSISPASINLIVHICLCWNHTNTPNISMLLFWAKNKLHTCSRILCGIQVNVVFELRRRTSLSCLRTFLLYKPLVKKFNLCGDVFHCLVCDSSSIFSSIWCYYCSLPIPRICKLESLACILAKENSCLSGGKKEYKIHRLN